MHLFSSIPLPVLMLLAAIAAVGIVALLYKAEDKLIGERKNCAALGKLLDRYGHTIASNVLQDLAVGDLPDALKTVEDTLKTLSDSTAGPALMQTDLVSQLTAQLAMPAAVPAILKTVAGFAANPANAAIVKAAGLAIVAAA